MKTQLLAAVLTTVGLVGCSGENQPSQSQAMSVEPKVLTDAMYQFALASRDAYASNVVSQLSVQRKIIATSEYWERDHVLPIPAQMIRYTNETFSKNDENVSVQLKSLWPINPANAPANETEREGLLKVSQGQSNTFYKTEHTPGFTIFTAVYGDTANSMSCVVCHNAHPKSEKRDFIGGDVLGGFVVTLKLPNGS